MIIMYLFSEDATLVFTKQSIKQAKTFRMLCYLNILKRSDNDSD